MLEVIESALRGGADIVQLRDKISSKRELVEKAKRLKDLTARYGVPLIVNDHPDVALAADADGVHLGQEDMPISVAREILGPKRIVGLSTHRIEQARAAEWEGADYIGVGPVFPTATKPGRQAVTTAYVSQAAADIRIPCVAIGGITENNADEVLKAGARRLCAVSAIVGHDDPEAVCRRLLEKIEAWNSKTPKFEEGLNRTGAPEIRVVINGRNERTQAATLLELAAQYKLESRNIVAELDGEVVPRRLWGETSVRGGCAVEFVHFVGGG
ncbi:thiamine phosphate synthase [Cohnella terricola]|uniref:Thiamine-phosphate synthase n=2 Tax=Cohnella terricola TaxID=1289167 RepID=A0A559JJE0_9BACL|nr:thiamine phosphate synthase [Cohnella terricola]